MTYDVVVIGCGSAALSAAVSAAEGGAKVAVLERAQNKVQLPWPEGALLACIVVSWRV